MNLLRPNLIIIFIALILLPATAFKLLLTESDDPVLKAILNKQEAFSKVNQQEKIFIQTDKTYYAAGDTIWFKGYVRNADTHTPTELSNILHLALVAGNQQEIQKLRLEIVDGLTAGYLVLPQDINQGNYTLVAYTRWMQNYDARFSYTRQIPIFNFSKNNPTPAGLAKATPQIYFFPEGGYLVNGLESKLAFKAIDSTGAGMAVTGTIKDNSGKTITSFKSSENGLGNFLFRPETGRTYTATIFTPKTKTFTTALPKPLDAGFIMSADNRNDSVCVVTVQKSAEIGNAPTDKVFLVAKSGNKVFYAEAKSWNNNNGQVIFNIPKGNLPEGVAQLTLFSQDGKPQAERLVYVHHKHHLTISLKPAKQTYGPHENVTVAVEVKDKNGKGVPANLSVSVTDENSLLAPEQNILSYLYLGAHVAGEVENATAYFANDLPETRLAMDNLLLTQGWRRFTWPEILTETATAKKYTPEKDLIFRARATTADGKPLPATLLNILMSGTGNAYAAFTDPNGYFSTILPDYETSGNAVFRFFKGDNALTDIKVTPILEPLNNWLPEPEVSKEISLAKWQKAYDWFRIQKAYYDTSAGRTKITQVNQNALYKKGQAGTTSYNLDTYVQFKNIAELFDEAIEPVALRKTKAGIESRVYSRQAKNYFTNSPLYIVDGKPTFDNKVVLSLPIDQIARIEVFNTPEYLQKFSLMGRDGVIAIYTKESNLILQNLSDSAVPFEGIFAGREFYQAPVKSLSSGLPDLRPRLYWQSTIKTDANGKAQISFKNADAITKFRIVVEGITASGLPGVGEVVYQVAKPN